jgi:hypothetical protein
MHTAYKSYIRIVELGCIAIILLLPAQVLAEEIIEQPIAVNEESSPVVKDEPLAGEVVDLATQPETKIVPEVEVKPLETEGTVANIFEPIEAPRDYLANKIVNFAKTVDEFFGDERYFQETNNSYLQLNFTETFLPGGERKFGFVGKAKIDLPSSKKRVHFVFEANPEQRTAGETQKDRPETLNERATTPEQYSASVRYEIDEVRWHFNTSAGVKLDFPLDPFVRARGSYDMPLWAWRLKLAETVFWFSSLGLGETTQLDLEYVLSPPVLFRATSLATCFESPRHCDLRQDFSIFHTLNERSAMLYQASVIGTNKPVVQETAYVLLMRYRHRLYKKWVFAEVTPQLNFPREDDFKMNALLMFRLEMLIGGT